MIFACCQCHFFPDFCWASMLARCCSSTKFCRDTSTEVCSASHQPKQRSECPSFILCALGQCVPKSWPTCCSSRIYLPIERMTVFYGLCMLAKFHSLQHEVLSFFDTLQFDLILRRKKMSILIKSEECWKQLSPPPHFTLPLNGQAQTKHCWLIADWIPSCEYHHCTRLCVVILILSVIVFFKQLNRYKGSGRNKKLPPHRILQ